MHSPAGWCRRPVAKHNRPRIDPLPWGPLWVRHVPDMARLGYHDVIRKNHGTFYMYNLGFGDSLVMFFYRFDFTMGFRHHHFFTSIWGKICFFSNHPTKQDRSQWTIRFFFKEKHPLKSADDFCCHAKPTPIPQSNKSERRWTLAKRNLTRWSVLHTAVSLTASLPLKQHDDWKTRHLASSWKKCVLLQERDLLK